MSKLISLSDVLASDSDLPKKEFSYFPDNKNALFNIRGMSPLDKDRFENTQRKSAVGMIYSDKDQNKPWSEYGEMIHRVLVGWRGVSMFDLRNSLPLKLGNISVEEMKESEIRFDKEALISWCKNDNEFCLWILQTASDRSNYQTEEDIDRLKKLSGSTSPVQ